MPSGWRFGRKGNSLKHSGNHVQTHLPDQAYMRGILWSNRSMTNGSIDLGYSHRGVCRTLPLKTSVQQKPSGRKAAVVGKGTTPVCLQEQKKFFVIALIVLVALVVLVAFI